MADATWRCASCDTYNDANASTCMVCDERRTRKQATSAGPTWRCSQCDTFNDSGRTSCLGCGTDRVAATTLTETVRGQTAAADPATGGSRVRRLPGDETKPAPPRESWRVEPPVPPVPTEPVPAPPGTVPVGVGAGAEPPASLFLPPVGATPFPGPARVPARRSSSAAWLVGFAAVILVGLIVLMSVVAQSGGSTVTPNSGVTVPAAASPLESSPADASPPSGQTGGQSEAQAVDALLDKAAASRSGLSTAIDEILDCSDVSGGAFTLQTITSDRESQLGEAQSLQVDALQNGDDMKNALVNALSDSLDADRAFLSWARDTESSGCSGSAPITSDYHRGENDSAAAGREKTTFVGLWNPIATSYLLTTRDDDDI
jgi:hypothetical protein